MPDYRTQVPVDGPLAHRGLHPRPAVEPQRHHGGRARGGAPEAQRGRHGGHACSDARSGGCPGGRALSHGHAHTRNAGRRGAVRAANDGIGPAPRQVDAPLPHRPCGLRSDRRGRPGVRQAARRAGRHLAVVPDRLHLLDRPDARPARGADDSAPDRRRLDVPVAAHSRGGHAQPAAHGRALHPDRDEPAGVVQVGAARRHAARRSGPHGPSQGGVPESVVLLPARGDVLRHLGRADLPAQQVVEGAGRTACPAAGTEDSPVPRAVRPRPRALRAHRHVHERGLDHVARSGTGTRRFSGS